MTSHAPAYLALVGVLAVFSFYLVRRRRLGGWSTLLVFASVFPVAVNVELSHVEGERGEAKLQASRELNLIANRLNGLVGSHIAAGEGVAAYIATHPDLSRTEFEKFARAVFERHPHLINLAAAPDLVISMIYPLKGNEAAVGLDYRRTPSQRDAVLRARDRGEAVLAGPVQLVQGGLGLLGRLPVFVRDGGASEFWGIVSATMDARAIFEAAGLRESNSNLQIAIRGLDGLGERGEVFFGDAELFNDAGTIHLPVTAEWGEWMMAARHPQPLGLAQGVWFLRLLALMVAAGWLIGLEQRQRARNNKQYYEKRLRASEQLMQEAGKLAGVAGWRIDKDSELLHFSEQFGKIIELPVRESAHREEVMAPLSPDGRKQLTRAVNNAFGNSASFDLELPVERSDSTKWLRIMGRAELQEGKVDEVVGAIQDVTERREFIQTIQHQATCDSLTGLPNRHQFDAFLEHELSIAVRRGQRVAVLYIDIDEFKSVNDNIGHRGGDLMLVESAKRIQACIRDCDIVARLSGDEFAVILSDIQNVNGASVVAAKVVAAMSQPFEIESRQIFSSASVGVALYPVDGEDAETLLINADQAMYEVKKSLRNDFTVFTRELHRRSEARHRMFNELSLAVSQRQLEVHYQPVVPLDGSKAMGCEALVRWRNGDTYVPPDAFIPLAEETGLIIEIDRFALSEATAFIQSLGTIGLEPPALSVNVSPRIFFDRAGEMTRWTEHVRECAQNIDLTLELTERLLTQDTPEASVVLQKLRAQGVKIAIDDFGTGYSSLSYLARFPIDTLKIDAFFVGKIPDDPSAVTLTETILSLGQKLSLRVVAEGVESVEQLEFLKRHGCQAAQGYWFGKPMTPEAFRDWLACREENPLRAGTIA